MKLKSKSILKSTCLLAFCVALAACETGKKSPTTQINQNLPDGDVITVVVSSEDFADLKKTQFAEESRGKCYDSNGAMPTSETAQALREMRLATGGSLDCGAGYNETLIAESDRKARQTEAKTGLVGDVLGIAATTGLKAFGIDKAAGVLGKAFDRSGNTTNVSEGSTYQGAQGAGASYTESQPIFSGIPTTPVEIAPTALTPAPESEEFGECTDLRPVLPSDPSGLDSNGDGLVCSDGSGGAFDN